MESWKMMEMAWYWRRRAQWFLLLMAAMWVGFAYLILATSL